MPGRGYRVTVKQRLSKYLPRNGQCHPGGDDQRRRLGTWTRAHWAWIEAAEMADPTAQQALDCYKERVKRAVDEKKDLESKVESQSEQPRWKPTMDVLSCMKASTSSSPLLVLVYFSPFSLMLPLTVETPVEGIALLDGDYS